MEIQVIVNGKVWLVPQAALPSLVAWLQANAVDANAARTQQMREVNENQSGKQLLNEVV